MSLSILTGAPRRRLVRRLALLAPAIALASLALAAPAHADAIIQIAGPTSPVSVGTSYTYTVTVPPDAFPSGPFIEEVSADLTGAAATFTAVASDTAYLECDPPSGTHVQCIAPASAVYELTHLTLTVLPTAAGTVTASTTASDGASPIGSDSTTTTIEGSTFPFTGFFSPVDNAPTVNSMKAGRAVPVKFSLGGDQGLDIFASGSPSSQQVNCTTGDPIDVIEQTVTAGSSSLQYDLATGQYTYVWKTDKAWKDTCRTLDLQLTDGTHHTADFSFN
jgi:hypothetical protein